MEHLYRLADATDAECLAALALQVFFDTYARQGIRPPVARHALSELSAEAFERRTEDPALRVIVAELDQHRVGFAVLALDAQSPVPGCPPTELATLYVSRHFARRGIGQLPVESGSWRNRGSEEGGGQGDPAQKRHLTESPAKTASGGWLATGMRGMASGSESGRASPPAKENAAT